MPLLTEEESALDPYRILGLEVGATDKEITKAYRKKALIWHSDKNQSEEARTSHILAHGEVNELTASYSIPWNISVAWDTQWSR